MSCSKDDDQRVYLCIDLKSFFASVEASLMGLDSEKDHLVVVDESRGQGAICLAISLSLRKLGIKNRCRLYEIPKGLKYVKAKPRMKKYMEYSAQIYGIYLKYVDHSDIHIYSIDECFLDITHYLKYYQKTGREIAKMIIDDIYHSLKIRATCGIGANLFLAKVALDIIAKKSVDYIGELDLATFETQIAYHRPITDIWGIGKGIASRLEKYGIYDLKGLSSLDPKLVYDEFGVNGEILLDHAKGIEPTTISDILHHEKKQTSFSHSQILFEDYHYLDAWTVLKEMIEVLTLELTEYNYYCQNISLGIGYSKETKKAFNISRNLDGATNSYPQLLEVYEHLFFKHVDQNYLIRRLSLSFNKLTKELYQECDLFYQDSDKDLKIQKVMNEVKKKYGKNMILRANSLNDKATARKRNRLIGGHNAE